MNSNPMEKYFLSTSIHRLIDVCLRGWFQPGPFQGPNHQKDLSWQLWSCQITSPCIEEYFANDKYFANQPKFGIVPGWVVWCIAAKRTQQCVPLIFLWKCNLVTTRIHMKKIQEISWKDNLLTIHIHTHMRKKQEISRKGNLVKIHIHMRKI